MRCQCLLLLTLLISSESLSAESPKDPGLELAKKSFEQRMREIEEKAERDREKATAKLREEYKDLIARKQKAGDEKSAEFFRAEARHLLGDAGNQGLDGFKKLRKRFPLMMQTLVQKDGTVEFKEDHDKNVPLVDGRPTRERFLFSPSPSSSTWLIPKGAKTFEVYADNIFPSGVPHNANCIMEIFIDGTSVAKTPVLTPASPVQKLVVAIPKGAKQLTLKTDPHQGGIDYDWCAWVEPAFFDR